MATKSEETEAPEFDPQVYLEKDPTDKMNWYQEWLTEQFPGLKFPVKQVALAVTLYPQFQKSDFNKERTAEKRAARAAEASKPADTENTAPRRRGRPAGSGTKPAAAKPTAGTKPATGRRGRGKPASAEAPF